MRVTAGLSDEDLIDPLGMPTEGWRQGGGAMQRRQRAREHDGWYEDCAK